MTKPVVYPLPPAALPVASARCHIQRAVLSSQGPLRSVRRAFGGVDERWRLDVSTDTLEDRHWKALEAIIHKIDGPLGYVRGWDPACIVPRGVAAGIHQGYQPGNGEAFSDGTYFTDGTGWTDAGSFGSVGVDTLRGATQLQINGLVPDQDRSLLSGDKFELGRLMYMIVADARSDALGRTTVQIRPRLRKPARQGDSISFMRPTSVFALRTDTEGIIERASPLLGQFSMSLVEIPEIEL